MHPYFELLAQSRVESAYFVVARRGKAPPLAPPQHGGARFADARSYVTNYSLRAAASAYPKFPTISDF